MEVVLNENIKKIGYKGEVVTVKRGFYRNYLAPRGLADFASKARLKLAESRKDKLVVEKQQLLDNAQDVLKKLKGLSVTISKKVTAKGEKLYAAVNEADVIEAVELATKLKLEKEYLKMEHFKDVGEHKVLVHLGEGLEETVTVQVEAAK